MNLILSGRGVKLDDQLRGYATDKLSKVERFFDRIIKMEVELRRERNPRVKGSHRVEVTLKTPRETLRAHGEGSDHFAAIDAAADRLEVQIKRFKSRLRDHPHRHLDPRENGSHLASVGSDDVSADEGPDVVRVPAQLVKPITVDEAILELETRELEFLLFTEAPTMSAAVVFRRYNGGFGIVSPEA